jgi:hypothetical protein
MAAKISRSSVFPAKNDMPLVQLLPPQRTRKLESDNEHGQPAIERDRFAGKVVVAHHGDRQVRDILRAAFTVQRGCTRGSKF